MSLNIPQKEISSAASPQSASESPKNSYNWSKTLAIGFTIISFCISIGVVGYILGAKKNQVIYNKLPQKQQVKRKPCGGIAGEVGKYKCTSGYVCKYPQPVEPDESGWCTKQ